MKGLALFATSLRARPLKTAAGLGVEYAGFVAACVFAALLLLTRVPLAWLDRVTGLGLRERLIDRIARLSPG